MHINKVILTRFLWGERNRCWGADKVQGLLVSEKPPVAELPMDLKAFEWDRSLFKESSEVKNNILVSPYRKVPFKSGLYSIHTTINWYSEQVIGRSSLHGQPS